VRGSSFRPFNIFLCIHIYLYHISLLYEFGDLNLYSVEECSGFVDFIRKAAHLPATHMIFGSESFVEIFLKPENHSVLEMGCWDHILFFGGTDPFVEAESCSIFMRIIRKGGKNQAFSKPVIPLTFLRGRDISLFDYRVRCVSS